MKFIYLTPLLLILLTPSAFAEVEFNRVFVSCNNDVLETVYTFFELCGTVSPSGGGGGGGGSSTKTPTSILDNLAPLSITQEINIESPTQQDPNALIAIGVILAIVALALVFKRKNSKLPIQFVYVNNVKLKSASEVLGNKPKYKRINHLKKK